MRCAIMQPTYLPWAGYFGLMDQVDAFVFLDDVQFSVRSWQSRNRILLEGLVHWLTVPVKKQGREQKISQISIDESQAWRQKHSKLLQHAYGQSPYKQELDQFIRIITEPTLTGLADLNIRLLRMVAEQLSIRPVFHKASDLKLGGTRSSHLLNICQTLGCDEYLSSVGSKEYLVEDGVFEAATVTLLFQKFTVDPYPQNRVADFFSHLSIVDVVANLGWTGAMAYIKKGEEE